MNHVKIWLNEGDWRSPPSPHISSWPLLLSFLSEWTGQAMLQDYKWIPSSPLNLLSSPVSTTLSGRRLHILMTFCKKQNLLISNMLPCHLLLGRLPSEANDGRLPSLFLFWQSFQPTTSEKGEGKEERGAMREKESERGDAINMGQYLIIIQDTRNLIKTTPPEWSHKERVSTICSSA